MSDRRTRNGTNSHYTEQEYIPIKGSPLMDMCYPGQGGSKPELIARDGCPVSKTEHRVSSHYDSTRTDSGFESIRSEKFTSVDFGVYLCSGVHSADLTGSEKTTSDLAIDSGTCMSANVVYEEDEHDVVTEAISNLKLLETLPRTSTSNPDEQLPKVKVDIEHPFMPDAEGDTLLNIAIIHKLPDLSFHLISIVPHISYLNEPNIQFQTPLHLAVITNQPRIVRSLVLAGVALDARDRRGNTALHLACERGDWECANELLRPNTVDEISYNYQPQLYLDLRNYEGKMCLHMAVLSRKLEIVKLLLDYGAHVNPQEGTSGRTPLHYAVELQDWEITNILLSTPGVDVNAQTFAGYTPIQYAYHRDTKLVYHLLNHGARDVGLPLSSDSESDNGSSDEITKMDSDDFEFCLNRQPHPRSTAVSWNI